MDGSPNLIPSLCLSLPFFPPLPAVKASPRMVICSYRVQRSRAHHSLAWVESARSSSPPSPSLSCDIEHAHWASSGNRSLFLPLPSSRFPRIWSPDPC